MQLLFTRTLSTSPSLENTAARTFNLLVSQTIFLPETVFSNQARRGEFMFNLFQNIFHTHHIFIGKFHEVCASGLQFNGWPMFKPRALGLFAAILKSHETNISASLE